MTKCAGCWIHACAGMTWGDVRPKARHPRAGGDPGRCLERTRREQPLEAIADPDCQLGDEEQFAHTIANLLSFRIHISLRHLRGQPTAE